MIFRLCTFVMPLRSLSLSCSLARSTTLGHGLCHCSLSPRIILRFWADTSVCCVLLAFGDVVFAWTAISSLKYSPLGLSHVPFILQHDYISFLCFKLISKLDILWSPMCAFYVCVCVLYLFAIRPVNISQYVCLLLLLSVLGRRTLTKRNQFKTVISTTSDDAIWSSNNNKEHAITKEPRRLKAANDELWVHRQPV